MGRGNKKNVIKTATEALKILWREGFFLSARKLNDTMDKLSQEGYNFPLTNVDKALQRAAYLTKRGKRGSFGYIQKYPFV